MKDLIALHSAVEAAGIPIHGVFEDRIDYRDEATTEQRAAGDAILAAWDWDLPPVPTKVTHTQAKLALLEAGLFEAVETYVMAAAQQDAAGIRFRLVWDANDWFRASPELNYLAGQMGMTAAEVDDLFRLAATK